MIEKFPTYFRELQLKFSRLFTRLLFEKGLTLPQYALLSLLVKGDMSMTEASEKLYITKPAVTNLVDKLEDNKFIKRLADPSDRRVNVLQIQPSGKKIVLEIQSQFLGILLGTLDQFNEREKETVMRFYQALGENVEKALG